MGFSTRHKMSDNLPEFDNEQDVIQYFQRAQAEYTQIQQKILELENDLRDHTLVAKALKDMDESRRCYRLVGQVLPAVNHQKSGIADIIEKLGQKLEVQGALIQAIQAKYKIRLRGQNDGAGPSSAAASSSSDNKHHGVLA